MVDKFKVYKDYSCEDKKTKQLFTYKFASYLIWVNNFDLIDFNINLN